MTYGHRGFVHPARVIGQRLSHREDIAGQRTNLGSLGDEIFEREGRLPILMLLLKLLGYVNHIGVRVSERIWGKRRGSTRNGSDGGVFCLG